MGPNGECICGEAIKTDLQQFCEECGAELSLVAESIRVEIDNDAEIARLRKQLEAKEKEAKKKIHSKVEQERLQREQAQEVAQIAERIKVVEGQIQNYRNELAYLNSRFGELKASKVTGVFNVENIKENWQRALNNYFPGGVPYLLRDSTVIRIDSGTLVIGLAYYVLSEPQFDQIKGWESLASHLLAEDDEGHSLNLKVEFVTKDSQGLNVGSNESWNKRSQRGRK